MGSSYKIPFELGTWAGLVAFASFFLIWLSPLSPLGYTRIVNIWIPVLFIFLAVYRQMKANGPEGLTFGNAFMVGMFTVLILGALKAVLVFIMVKYIDLNLIADSFDERVHFWQVMRKYSLTPEMVDQNIEFLLAEKEKATPYGIASDEASLNIMGGLPISLLAALIFNRKPKNA